jgi:hypothetical protein
MKNLTLIGLLICTLYACKKDNEQYPQKWQLISMSGQIPNSETVGTEMSWQEYYLLKANGTFIKSRKQDGVTTEASGTYSFKTSVSSNEKYLILTYGTFSSIIGSCTSDLTELMLVKSNTDMISSWMACDGPGLEYKREE